VRITLIHNPGAGRQRAGAARKLVEFLSDHGHAVRYYSAKEDGWKRALRKPADLVVVAGGDGTVAKVTRRMVGRGVPLGVLPSGTANNIARTLGLVERPFEELVVAWQRPRRVKLDVGIAAGPWGERYFVEGVGAGLFAGLLTDPAKKPAKKRKGAVEAGLQRLRDQAGRCEPLELRAKLDGKDISGSYLLVEALNLPYVGPNLHLAHDSQPGDGQFDVVLVTEAERDRLLYYLEHWQENRERLGMLPTRRGRRLKIEWTGFALHIDDKLEPRPKAKPSEVAGLVEARIDGDAVEFLVPA
jgi:diacylglycerol kinase family enzyme